MWVQGCGGLVRGMGRSGTVAGGGSRESAVLGGCVSGEV